MRESGVDFKSNEYLMQQLGEEVKCTESNYRKINRDSVMCEREPLDLTDKALSKKSSRVSTWGVH